MNKRNAFFGKINIHKNRIVTINLYHKTQIIIQKKKIPLRLLRFRNIKI
jgi:hypothetical protein